MNDDEIQTLAEGIAVRGGLHRLIRLLGFTEPLRKRRAQRAGRVPVRSVRSTARETLRAHVFDLRDACSARMLRELSRNVRDEDAVAHHLLVVSEPRRRRVIIACDMMHDGLRHIVLEPGHVRRSDIDALRELAALSGESGTAAALRIHRALDRRRLTTRFFRDIRGVRDAVSRAWTGLPEENVGERDALALLLLSRLMFLYFLQRRGLLAGDMEFLPRVLARWRRRRGARRSFYRTVLRTLFFGVLNRRPAVRTARARGLGELPYLNGGLFERHHLERSRPSLDLSDAVVANVFDALLEKYRFASGDGAVMTGRDDIGAGIDPEMLGRIFEGLMPGDRRSRTGTFYTPAATVELLVADALSSHLSRTAGVPLEMSRRVLLREPSDASDRDLRSIAEAAAQVRVLDPACGSGAFLLGALAALERARGAAAPDTRREIVGRSLHGVDLLEDAALICSLRLWLSLIPDCDHTAAVPPLPNLDRRIRQGDALIDPLDIGAALAGRTLGTLAPQNLRSLLKRLEPAAARYMTSDPETRPVLRRSMAALETRIARAWLETLHRQLAYEVRELDARSRDVDLFGARTASADAARGRLAAVTARLESMQALRSDLGGSGDVRGADDVHGAGALPFFSFRVHFAETDAFDVVLSNPPWVRAHNWPQTMRALLRERYRVCADAGWPHAAMLTATPPGAGAQVDLAFLFLERSLRLLRDGGTLGMVLPAKLIRSLAPGGARALLLSNARLASIEDHSLDQRAVFDADAFTAVIVAERTIPIAERSVPSVAEVSIPIAERSVPSVAEVSMPPVPRDSTSALAEVRVRMTRGDSELRFAIMPGDLPLRPGDARSPWLLAPPQCHATFRCMQRAGDALGASGLCVRRGAMTGANEVMVAQDVEPKLGDLARIRAEGYYRRTTGDRRTRSERRTRTGDRRTTGDRRRFAGYVEASALKPVLRGTDVQAWRIRVERHVLWTPRNVDPRADTPRRLSAYLARHAAALNQPADRLGTLQRLSAGMYGHKVAWSDLAANLRAAAVPASVRAVTGLRTPIVPMNTVYFIPAASHRDTLLLAGYLNSMPVRTFARAIAERAKDAHFRFFAWTIAMLPLPHGWRDGAAAERVVAISRDAHRAGAIEPRLRDELDVLIAQTYGLDTEQLESIAAFDAWLGGKGAGT